MKKFIASKAFIINDGKVLLLKESTKYKDGTNAGKYDVVGGRIKEGEDAKESLLREIKEETGLSVRIGESFFKNQWNPVVKGEGWNIKGTFYECFADTNQLTLSKDHEEFVWINPKDYRKTNIIENLNPAFETYLRRWLSSKL